MYARLDFSKDRGDTIPRESGAVKLRLERCSVENDAENEGMRD